MVTGIHESVTVTQDPEDFCMSDAQSLYAPEWAYLPRNIRRELNRTIWTDSFQRNHGGELTIDGIAASELVKS